MKFAKCLENRRFPCYNNTNAKSVPSGAQANRTGSGRAYMNCAEIRRLPWLIRLLTSALLAALVLTPAPLALSASRTRPLSMLLLVLTAVLAKVLAPLVQSSRNNHSVPNPLCSVCCAGDFLMQKFIGQYRIILSADTASEVRQLPERYLSRQAGIVRYCPNYYLKTRNVPSPA